MPNPAAGVYKRLGYKVETTFGTAAGASGAQLLRRLQSTLDLSKDTYQSEEIRPDFQIADFRHGVRRVNGAISGELSARTYSDFFAAALKRDFTALTPASGVALTIAAGAVVGTVQTYDVTRGTGSWITDAFKVGHVMRLSVGALHANNINKNLLILSLTATVANVMTLNGTAMNAEGPIAGCTATVTGKQTFVPQTGHTDKSFTIEHFYQDLGETELFTGCKIDKIDLNLPPTGMATASFEILGQNMAPQTGAYFTTPTAITTTSSLAAVNGALLMNGVPVAILTGLTISIDPTFTGDPVVGSNMVPFLFPGRVMVTGQMTAYFSNTTLRDMFLNETEVSLIAAFTSDNTATADFLTMVCPRIKVGGAAKDDGDKALIQTLPFTALLNSNGGTGTSSEKTTFLTQDSQA